MRNVKVEGILAHLPLGHCKEHRNISKSPLDPQALLIQPNPIAPPPKQKDSKSFTTNVAYLKRSSKNQPQKIGKQLIKKLGMRQNLAKEISRPNPTKFGKENSPHITGERLDLLAEGVVPG